MKRILFICAFASLLGLSAKANNVQITGAATIEASGVNSNQVNVTFKISWDNSWRDEINWDAVYVFMKYRVAGPPYEWHHVYLKKTGHTTTSPLLEIVPAQSGELVTGIFLQRSASGTGNIAQSEVTVCWDVEENAELPIRKQDLIDQKIEVAVEAIEMVYVPAGAFFIGDALSTNTLKGDANTVGGLGVDKPRIINADIVPYATDFPTGFHAFYCMKYEISQEQYVKFLNKLTYAQQQERVSGLANMEVGTFILGSGNYRAGIVVSRKATDMSNDYSYPAIFANNRDGDKNFNETNDGQNVACNYLSPYDMLAYCSWSGLRPMSELEYEKACRNICHVPVRGEYIWQTNEGLVAATSYSYANQDNETPSPSTANVNYSWSGGPLRCGSFARGAGVDQKASGASWWGIMELTGNLAEICYTVLANNTGAKVNFVPNHGVGIYNTNTAGWPNSTATAAADKYFILRGGHFSGGADRVRISDRGLTWLYSKINYYYSTFRAVHTAPDIPILSEPGSISCQNGNPTDQAYTKTPYAIWSVEDATYGNFNVFYEWYMKTETGSWTKIQNEHLASLVYTFSSTGTFSFKRRAFCDHILESNEVTVTVVAQP